MPQPIVVASLAEEYGYLDRWFGPGKYRLARRDLSYEIPGRVLDLVEIAAGAKTYRVVFDTTRIRPPAPAGMVSLAGKPASSWILPIVIAGTAIGLVVYSTRRSRRRK